MNKTILITGANGQLGREMRVVLNDDIFVNAIYTDVEELDITNARAIDDCLTSNKVDYIVNCAAYTAVDAAESNVELCTKLNVEAPTLLAQAATRHGAKFIHVSTDYVFDGTSCRPYRENDRVCPVSVYGKTKLDGELHIMDIAPESIIVRTAWLYSPHGKNFVKTMLELGRSRDSLRVVCDQIGTPTSALDLASAIKSFIDCEQWLPGIYHFSNEGAISWYDFTIAIHRLAGITTCHVLPCMTEDYPTPAARPHYSVLDKSKIKSTLGFEIPYWEESLEQCINLILNDK